MASLDWWVMGLYLLAMLLGAWWLGRRQGSTQDYFLAGRGLPNWALAHSIIATQCSSNSLLGAPAFVGFAVGGGLAWLQYELAVPLAMLWLCVLFLPIRRAGVISVYAFLELRLGRQARLLASGCFLLFRGVATGVILYGVASVVALISELSFAASVALIMVVTLAYDVLGGLRAVVISDIVQAVLLLAAVLLGLWELLGPLERQFVHLGERTVPLVNDWGLGSGNQYGFWPMLFGGLFLYAGYYGCDQTQSQRLLASRTPADTQKVLMLNGLMRFPLVLCYCLLGLGLAAFSLEQPGFLDQLPLNDAGEPNLNLVFPQYVLMAFSPGVVGLVMVGLLAAAMSSIDSALNSLSACTLEDFVGSERVVDERRGFLLAKGITLAWGLAVVGFAFHVEAIAPTVLEAINKIGSMANGPLLALFVIALKWPGVGQRAAIGGFVVGVLANLACGWGLPGVSWLWWNPLGFSVALLVAKLMSQGLAPAQQGEPGVRASGEASPVPGAIRWPLVTMTALILLLCALLSF